jgi:hypothetical protein
MFMFGSALAQNDSIIIKKYPRMGFSDLNIGEYSSIYSGSQNSAFSDTAKTSYTNINTAGISLRFQASVLDFYWKREHKKFEFADILSSEFMAGVEYTTTPTKKVSPWYGYRFEAGIGSKYKINRNNELGLNIILLKVGTDNQSTYFIGSNIMLRYRYKRLLAEMAMETRKDRFLGFFWAFQSWYYNPLQFSCQVRYLLDHKRNIGVRVEYYSSQLTRHINEVPLLENEWTLRIFYGIYF